MQPTVDDVRRFIAAMVESGNTDYGILADMVEEAGLCGELVYALRTGRMFSLAQWTEVSVHLGLVVSDVHRQFDFTIKWFEKAAYRRELNSMGLLNEQGE